MTKSSMDHLETDFSLLCEISKSLCNIKWEVPQARNKIWHSIHWLHKTLKVLKPNFRAFSELSKFGAWGETLSYNFAANYKKIFVWNVTTVTKAKLIVATFWSKKALQQIPDFFISTFKLFCIFLVCFVGFIGQWPWNSIDTLFLQYNINHNVVI